MIYSKKKYFYLIAFFSFFIKSAEVSKVYVFEAGDELVPPENLNNDERALVLAELEKEITVIDRIKGMHQYTDTLTRKKYLFRKMNELANKPQERLKSFCRKNHHKFFRELITEVFEGAINEELINKLCYCNIKDLKRGAVNLEVDWKYLWETIFHEQTFGEVKKRCGAHVTNCFHKGRPLSLQKLYDLHAGRKSWDNLNMQDLLIINMLIINPNQMINYRQTKEKFRIEIGKIINNCAIYQHKYFNNVMQVWLSIEGLNLLNQCLCKQFDPAKAFQSSLHVKHSPRIDDETFKDPNEVQKSRCIIL